MLTAVRAIVGEVDKIEALGSILTSVAKEMISHGSCDHDQPDTGLQAHRR